MTLAFDVLEAPESPLARLDPRWRLGGLVVAGVLASLLREPLLVYAAGALAVGLLVAARLPRRWVLARLSALALFLLPFVIVLPVLQGLDGLKAAALVGTRALTLFLLALVLVSTAPFYRTIHAAQALGAPRVLTQIVLMSYRYVFVLRDEFVRMRTALRVRGFRAGTTMRTYRTVGLVTGALLVRGEERAERVAQAMRCRGFDGRFRSLQSFQTRAADVLFFALAVGAAASLFAADRLLRW